MRMKATMKNNNIDINFCCTKKLACPFKLPETLTLFHYYYYYYYYYCISALHYIDAPGPIHVV